jgi:hypothetical protein
MGLDRRGAIMNIEKLAILAVTCVEGAIVIIILGLASWVMNVPFEHPVLIWLVLMTIYTHITLGMNNDN